jgi:O-acetyl-ADP-ribose deacetylase (regulator of RNase III)/uncharacterized protein YwgA
VITRVRKGDLLQSDAQTLVNTVNTVGVMGKGVALDFKKRFPDMFDDYVKRCSARMVKLGEPYLFRRLVPPWIINFPTKEHWRAVSKLDDIVRGLEYLTKHLQEWEVESLAVPPLGCGNGQLEWDVVGPTLFRHLDALPIPVELHAPFDAMDEAMTIDFLRGGASSIGDSQYLSGALVAIAEIVKRLSSERYAWPVGHTRFQKLCYFASVAGIPLEVEFEERPYGPFASGLKRATSRLVNNGVIQERASGQYQLIEPGPTFDDAERRFASALAEYRVAIEKVTDLMLRLSPARTELAATVHFAAHARAGALGRPPTDAEVIDNVRRWKKDRFQAPEVTAALASLAMLDWLHLGATDVIDKLDEDSAVAFA